MLKTSKYLYFIFHFLINAVSWLIVHLAVSKLIGSMEVRTINRLSILFRTYPFEKNGQLWNDLFKVKRWKAYIPESTSIMPDSFDQSRMKGTDLKTINQFIDETNRAELTHWASILPVPLFFIWNPGCTRGIHLSYALLSNMPFIIAQRYNRPRLRRMYRLKCRNENRHKKERDDYEKRD